MNKTCIISGINGQLGQFLAKHLQDNEPNIQIIGTLRHKSYDKQPYIFDKSKVIFELMDLSDTHSIENLILKYKPDYFINTAANAYVGESWKVPAQQFELNTLGVLHQLEAIRKHSPYTRYFNMGTSEEFGQDNNDGKLQNEESKIDPKSPYGCSKAAARYLVNTYRRSYNLYALQGWTFNFESELRGEKYVTKKITLGVARIYHAIKNNQPFEPILLGNIDSMRSWQFCGDVANGIWRMLNQELYQESEPWDLFYNEDKKAIEYYSKRIKSYVMSASNCHTVRDFVTTAFGISGIKGVWTNLLLTGETKNAINEVFMIKNGGVLVKISPEFFRPHDVTYLNGDASLIKKELGWKSTLSFEDLVNRMVQYDINNYVN
jgi:GDPmannose 4,6-dehydratase